MIHSGFQIITCQCWQRTEWSEEDGNSSFWRIYFHLDEGAWVQESTESTLKLGANTLYIAPAETRFSCGLTRPVRQLFSRFLVNGVLRTVPRGIHRLQIDDATLRRVTTLAENLLLHPLEDGDNCPEIVSIVGAVLADHDLLQRSRRPLHPGVGKVLAILESKNYPALDNPQMARLAGMSTNALIRAFNLEMGITPQSWLREKRILMACHRMLHTSDTISQIAETHGFANRYHFTRVFRAVRGVSPAAWRRDHLRKMWADPKIKKPISLADDEKSIP